MILVLELLKYSFNIKPLNPLKGTLEVFNCPMQIPYLVFSISSLFTIHYSHIFAKLQTGLSFRS